MPSKWLLGGAIGAVVAVVTATAVLRETARSSLVMQAPPASQSKGSLDGAAPRSRVAERASAPGQPNAPAAKADLAFDVVRVGRDGVAVIAGHGAPPAATVTLLDADRRIETATADAAGQFVILPPAFAAGTYGLRLVARVGAGTRQESAVAHVTVAAPNASATLPHPATATAQLPSAPAAGQPVAIGAIEVDRAGALIVSGRGSHDHRLRLLLNRTLVAEVLPDADRTWSVRVEAGLEPGRYAVQIEDLGAARNDDVAASAETFFEYGGAIAPASDAPGAASRSWGAPAGSGGAPGPWLATAEHPAPASSASPRVGGLARAMSARSVVPPRADARTARWVARSQSIIGQRNRTIVHVPAQAAFHTTRVLPHQGTPFRQAASIRYGRPQYLARSPPMYRPPLRHVGLATPAHTVVARLQPALGHAVSPSSRRFDRGALFRRAIPMSGRRGRNARRIFAGQTLLLAP